LFAAPASRWLATVRSVFICFSPYFASVNSVELILYFACCRGLYGTLPNVESKVSRKHSIFLTLLIWLWLVMPCSLNAVRADEQPASDNGASGNGASDPIAIYTEAGANQAQLESIKLLAEGLQSVNTERAKEIMGLIRDIRNLSLQPDLDGKKLLADQNRVNSLQSAMASERIKVLIKIRQLLTPPQREKLVTLMRVRREAKSP
jgi:Spy/CpxP family protein refolding chaperone